MRVGNLEEAENVAGEYGHYYNRDQAVVIEDLINGVDDKKGYMVSKLTRFVRENINWCDPYPTDYRISRIAQVADFTKV